MIPRPIRALALLTTLAVAAAACSMAPGAPSAAVPSAAVDGYDPASCPAAQPAALAAGERRNVTIATDLGDIVIDIAADLSPIAAGNFVTLAECGWYDGVVFHRVVPGFVIQGGDGQHGRSPNVDAESVGTGGPGYTITDEPVTTPYGRGVVAMARTSAPNSVGSQFFIVLDDDARGSLESANTYQIIGSVSAGMETADAIAAAADAEIPTEPVVMTDVSVANP
jgi:cyclophilin family peptidyl-prolyl cis-trans isomerase